MCGIQKNLICVFMQKKSRLRLVLSFVDFITQLPTNKFRDILLQIGIEESKTQEISFVNVNTRELIWKKKKIRSKRK